MNRYLPLALAALFVSLASISQCSAMSYAALDMRNPEKCVMAYYPEDTKLEILYEMLGKFKVHVSI